MSERSHDEAAELGGAPGEPPRLLLLAEGDDVLIAATNLEAGPYRTSSGAVVVVSEAVALGHKVAARSIGAGEHVVRCGVPIGSTTRAISAGAWVHTHNLASDYLETFAHRGGER